jgi:hypothetical protein
MTVSELKAGLWAGAIVISILASTASASTLSLTYHGATSSDDRKTVKINKAPPDYPGVGDWPKTVGAWGFKMNDSSGELGDFVAWCLDVGDFLSTSSNHGKPYKITENPFSNIDGLTGFQQDRVESFFNANYDKVDVEDGVKAAGFQLALWEALYDEDYNLADGSFKVSADGDITNIADEYLTSGASYNGSSKFRFSYLESSGNTKYQNLVTVTPVPLPGAAGMLILALGSIGLVKRRSKVI